MQCEDGVETETYEAEPMHEMLIENEEEEELRWQQLQQQLTEQEEIEQVFMRHT